MPKRPKKPTPAIAPPAGGSVRLYHGTNYDSAKCILVDGVDWKRARQTGGEGEFWCTVKEEDAMIHAACKGDNSPTLVRFDLPTEALNECLQEDPSTAEIHSETNIEF